MTEEKYRIRIKLENNEIEAEGDKEFVEKWIEEFKQEMPKYPERISPIEKIAIPEKPSGKPDLEKLSLAEFYQEEDPKNFNETFLVFAYWLQNKEGKSEFTPKDIKACYKIINLKTPANVPDVCRRLAGGKKAYFIKEKKGIYKLSMRGEEFVEKSLPNKKQ